MLPLEHSAILLTCIKRKSALKTNFGLLFDWQLKTGFTVVTYLSMILHQTVAENDANTIADGTVLLATGR